MRIGVMGALEEEVGRLNTCMTNPKADTVGGRTYYQGELFGRDAVLVFSRLGKVAAASTATTLIERYKIDALLFIGVAGGVNPELNIGDIVVADELMQHDMDASPLYPQYEIPLLDLKSFEATPQLRDLALKSAQAFLQEDWAQVISTETQKTFGMHTPKAVTGTILSGDQFVSESTKIDALRQSIPSSSCIEMEGAAVAQVCYEHAVPFAVIRAISDKANSDAEVDFLKFIESVACVYSEGVLKRLMSTIYASNL